MRKLENAKISGKALANDFKDLNDFKVLKYMSCDFNGSK